MRYENEGSPERGTPSRAMRSNKSFVVGVIGHVDHGKTGLVRALTGMETDRLPEERRRGISIALGFAHFSYKDCVIDLIDVPGHERFVRTMIAGATGFRAILLVVAANEGIKPQTIEHAEIAALLGCRDVIVAVSKTDLVAAEQAVAVGRTTSDLATGLGLHALTPVLTSARTGQGLEHLKRVMTGLLSHTRPLPNDGFCYLPIDRAFSIAGHGTVLTGTLRRGTIEIGAELGLVPNDRSVRVRGLQVRGAATKIAWPGERVAVNLRSVDKTDAHRSMALASRGLFVPSIWLTVELTAARHAAAPISSGAHVRVFFGTSEAGAVVRLLDRDELDPGGSCFAQLRCTPRVAMPVRERLILRAGLRVVAGGCVLDTAAPRLRRRDAAALARLAILARKMPAEIIARELDAAGFRGSRTGALAQVAGLSPEQVQDQLHRLGPVTVGDLAVVPSAVEEVMRAIIAVLKANLTEHPNGLRRDRLQHALKGCAPEVLDLALLRLAQLRRVERAGIIRLRQTEQERARVADESVTLAHLAEFYRRDGLTPQAGEVSDIMVRRSIARLVHDGVLVRVFDHVQKREIVFHREAIEHARRILAPLLADDAGLLVTEAGAALGISRKYSVPLLEHLDAIQFTRRIGDRRVLRRQSTKTG
ncbi:MAG: selenocysteine-specific translation elongation factor [Pseudomonadota bacterium]|nr:selenocysteine-specific translation elongation factor [Pseudomonadota bacterium]